ncbi:UNVERIFIED_CONTAM: hypothetical protein GTU68_052087 [Idotea baltica]|nr:hypothetical protein [Idotea baltica]
MSFIFCLVSISANASFLDKTEPDLNLSQKSNTANEAPKFLSVNEAFKLQLVSSKNHSLKLHFDIHKDYYLYKKRFHFSTQNKNITLSAAQIPKGQSKVDDYFGKVEIYHSGLDIILPFTSQTSKPFTLSVTYQGCAEKGLCYPPKTEKLKINTTKSITSTTNQSDKKATPQITKSLILFFLAGIGLAFTPCVLPMLPILSSIVLRGSPSTKRGFILSLAYVLPMAISYAILGVLMGLFGASLNLQARLQSPWILVPFALFFALFAATMFDFFELRLPRFISERLDKKTSKVQGGSIIGAATLGALSSLVVSPCITAPLTGLLLYISSTGDAIGGGLQLLALGIGMGTPLLLMSVGGKSLLPKAGAWMNDVRGFFGILLLAVSIWLLERVIPGPIALGLWGLLAAGTAISLNILDFSSKNRTEKIKQTIGLLFITYALCAWTGALTGNTNPLQPLSGAIVATTSQSNNPKENTWTTIHTNKELLDLQSQSTENKQALLVDWYADWCISCKIIEHKVLPDPGVQQRLKHFKLVRFDLTESNTQQRAILDHYKLFGPPAILLFNKNGSEWNDLRIIGEIDAAHLIKKLDQAIKRL